MRSASAFLMYRQLADIDPRYRESAEESLVETAQLLAALIEHASPDGGAARRVARAGVPHRLRAPLQGRHLRRREDPRRAARDRRRPRGTVRVRLRAAAPSAPTTRAGTTSSCALRGEYGARTTPDIEGDPRTSVMYVAVPIHDLSPAAAAHRRRGQRRQAGAELRPVRRGGAQEDAAARRDLGGRGAAARDHPVGLAGAAVRRDRRLRALRARQRSFSLPRLGRRALGAIGAAYDEMRDALAGRNYVADYVQTLTHEVKGPLSAIRGAAELLQEPMAEADRAASSPTSRARRSASRSSSTGCSS
jgi:two-component system sensor histidine kinase CreC